MGTGTWSPNSTPTNSGHRRRRLRRWLLPLAFLFPAVVVLGAFRLVPFVDVMRLSLTKWNGFSDPEFIGFENYTRMIEDPVFLVALKNNFIVLLVVPLGVIVPFFLSVILHARPWGWKLFRMAFFLPAVLSPVIIGSFFEVMLRVDGPFNAILTAIGLGGLTRGWLADPHTALPSYMAVMLWVAFGVGVVLILAALQAVDPDVEDSARIDGASWWQIQRHVVMPQVRPTLEFWAILLVIVVFTTQFPLVYTLTRGGPGNASTILEFLIYQRAFASGALGFAAAMGVVLFVIVAVLAIAQLFLGRRRRWE